MKAKYTKIIVKRNSIFVVAALTAALTLFALTACGQIPGITSKSTSQPASHASVIKAVVSKNCNYVYHMLSVSKCGYENKYGEKYEALHPPEDLAKLKALESYITVKGGEHSGELYDQLVSLPAALGDDIAIADYYAALADLFGTGELEQNLERYRTVYSKVYAPLGVEVNIDTLKAYYGLYEQLSQELSQIAQVMADNYAVYDKNVWKTSEAELSAAANALNAALGEADYAQKWEEILKREYKHDNFYALLCNSIDGGAQAINISPTQDVFAATDDASKAAAFVSHEFGIYMLMDALGQTQAFSDKRYWEITEALAEYYNLEISGGANSGWSSEYIEFYKKLREENFNISPYEMFEKAKARLG